MESRHIKGIKLRAMGILMAAVVFAAAMLLLIVANLTRGGYRDLQEATEDYIASQQDAKDLQDSSDYLTEQVRAFVITGEPEYARNFYREVTVTRRRDKAVENMQNSLAGTETYEYLSEALAKSNELVHRENYAMALAGLAYGLDAGQLPQELSQVELEEADRRLSREEQLEKACALVFDDGYRSYKEQIRANVTECTQALIGQTRDRQTNSSARLLRLLRHEEVLVSFLLVLVFSFVLLIFLLVIRPLQQAVGQVEKHGRFPERGVYEIRFLADTYNRMLDQTRANQEQLSYEATHDALTGLYNRAYFEKLRESWDSENIALILVDIDHFKSVNDSYGHDMGDRVLEKVSALLRASFRHEDAVCRIGGDEFAVVMVNASSALRELVEHKILALNGKLDRPEDGLPHLSLSVGVAFGDRDDPGDDLYKDADTALYRVKNKGGGGCAFY